MGFFNAQISRLVGKGRKGKKQKVNGGEGNLFPLRKSKSIKSLLIALEETFLSSCGTEEDQHGLILGRTNFPAATWWSMRLV